MLHVTPQHMVYSCSRMMESVCVCLNVFFSLPAGDGVLRCRLHHRLGKEHQRQHAERGLDRLHLQRDPQGEGSRTILLSESIVLVVGNWLFCSKGVEMSYVKVFTDDKEVRLSLEVMCLVCRFLPAGIGSPARPSRHPPWHQGTKRAADWKRRGQTGYVPISLSLPLSRLNSPVDSRPGL